MTIAFYLPGGVPVYTFSLLLGLGATIGLVWVAWRSPAKQVHRNINAGLWALLGGLLGGRAAFAAIHWDYFQHHPMETLEFFKGGISWPGALAGSFLALTLVSTFTHSSGGTLAEAMLPLLATLTVTGWLGCWLNGCAYGPITDAWWGLPSRDEWGLLNSRYPTQLLGALLALFFFWVLDKGRGWLVAKGRTPRPGLIASLGVLGLSLEMWALSYLRADPARSWNGLRLEAWAALGFALLAILAILISLIQYLLKKKG